MLVDVVVWTIGKQPSLRKLCCFVISNDNQTAVERRVQTGTDSRDAQDLL